MNIKNIYKLGLLLFSFLFFVSCEEEIDYSVSNAENKFELTTPSVSNVFMNFNYPTNPAFTVVWEDTKTGATSYTVQFSKSADFATPVVLGTVTAKQFTISVSNLNNILNGQGITAYSNTPIFIRVVGNGNNSNAVVFNINAYPTVNPVMLQPAANTAVVLNITTPDDVALSPSWKDDAINANTTVSVLYKVQLALGSDTNFTNPRLLKETSSLDTTITHEVINQAALTLGVTPLTATAMKLRVIAVMESTSGEIIRNSDPIAISLTAYPNYPELYLVGDATAAGWDTNNNNHVMFKDPYQSGKYVYRGYFNAGQIKMVEVKGQWQPQWGKGATDGSLAGNPGTQTNDPGTIVVATAGYYTFTVNMANLTYTLEAYDASSAPTYATIGIIGQATPTGWGSDTDMTQSSFNPHIWYNNSMSLNQSVGGDCDCGFKFRADNDWPNSWGGEQNPPTENYGIATLSGGKNIGVPETGTYTVFFNDLDGRYWYVKN